MSSSSNSNSNSNSNDNEREASHGVGQRAASPGLTNEADNNGGNDNDNGSSPRHTVPSDGADAESNVPSTLAQAAASNAELVANHYNTRRELGIEGRMHTKITGLRLFNNWIKSILIGRHTTAGCKVLDLGCGKGGDLRKWAITGIGEYVGMDIAQVSVSQAQKRYSEMHNVRFKASFFAQDCYGEPLEKTLQPPDYQADVISAQFCLHYAFETEKKARQMMENVSSHLAPGGRFMCTIPNSNWLVKKKRLENSNRFGNNVYSVEFAQNEPFTAYGTAYSFTLDEAVEDCTEYLVHMPTFIELASSFGLTLKYQVEFHELYRREMENTASVRLFHRMKVVDETRPSISPGEWEAIGIYMAVVFEKSELPALKIE